MSVQTYTAEETKLLRSTIGSRLKASRRAAGLTQEQVAAHIGKNPGFYGRVERGDALPAVATLVKVANLLNISADDLLGLDEIRPPMVPVEHGDEELISWIVERVRNNRPLMRIVTMVLKVCERRPCPRYRPSDRLQR